MLYWYNLLTYTDYWYDISYNVGWVYWNEENMITGRENAKFEQKKKVGKIVVQIQQTENNENQIAI